MNKAQEEVNIYELVERLLSLPEARERLDRFYNGEAEDSVWSELANAVIYRKLGIRRG